jgi:hypothetical protein
VASSQIREENPPIASFQAATSITPLSAENRHTDSMPENPYTLVESFGTKSLVDRSGTIARRPWRETGKAPEKNDPICIQGKVDVASIRSTDVVNPPYTTFTPTGSTLITGARSQHKRLEYERTRHFFIDYRICRRLTITANCLIFSSLGSFANQKGIEYLKPDKTIPQPVNKRAQGQRKSCSFKVPTGFATFWQGAQRANSLLIKILASKVTTCLALTLLIRPAAAQDPVENALGPVLEVGLPPMTGLTLGAFVGTLLILGAKLCGILKALPAPLMGASSVLFVMFRNDKDVNAEISWR